MMRAPSRRFGIAALSLTLVATLFGTTQAGLIPWVYNAIFGPVGSCAPQPFAYPYSAAGYGCRPCIAPVAMRCAPSPCSSGSCPTYVSYGVRPACATSAEVTQWKAGNGRRAPEAEAGNAGSGAAEVTKTAPLPTDPAPAPTKTFVDDGNLAEVQKPDAAEATETAAAEGSETNPGAVGPVVNVQPVAPSAPKGSAAEVPSGAGFEKTPEEAAVETPAAVTPAVDPFKRPTIGEEAEEETGVPAPGLQDIPEALQEAAGLDAQASWKLTVPTHRQAKRSGHGNAWIARRSVPVNSEYVIPRESVARILSVTRIVSRD